MSPVFGYQYFVLWLRDVLLKCHCTVVCAFGFYLSSSLLSTDVYVWSIEYVHAFLSSVAILVHFFFIVICF